MPTDSSAFCAPRPRRSLSGDGASAPSSGAHWPAPNGFQRNGEKTEAEHIGDELAPLQRKAEISEHVDGRRAEGKPAEKDGEPPAPEASSHPIGRNDAEALGIGGEQQIGDDQRDTGDQEGDEIAEQHLAKERRPIKRQEGAEAADGERYDHAKGKGEARSDETQAVVYRLHWEFGEALACLLRRLAKQPLDAKAQSRKSEDEPDDGSPGWNFRLEEADGPLELVGQIGESNAQRNKMLADRGNTGIDVMRDRLGRRLRFVRGLGRVLLDQPLLDLRIGEQCHELGDFRRRRCLLARAATRPIPCAGAAAAPDSRAADRKSAARQVAQSPHRRRSSSA